jgi:hypothetical protein
VPHPCGTLAATLRLPLPQICSTLLSRWCGTPCRKNIAPYQLQYGCRLVASIFHVMWITWRIRHV